MISTAEVSKLAHREMTTPTHITTSGGLISAAFIENVRGPVSRQRGTEPESFALPIAGSPFVWYN